MRGLALTLALLCVASSAAQIEFSEAELRQIKRLSPLPPAAPSPTNRFADDPRAAHLGQFLFFDDRMSRFKGVSCVTCHMPEHALSDGRTLAEGLGLGDTQYTGHLERRPAALVLLGWAR